MKQTVVVTGASGFVGQAICAQLMAAGYEVEGWYRHHLPPKVSRALQVDLTGELPPPPDSPVHALIHTAAVAHARPTPRLLRRLEEVNVGGTSKMLDWAARANIERFLFLSSVKAQGTPPAGTLGRESDPAKPEGPYGEAKRRGEEFLADWAAGPSGSVTSRSAIALRLPLVYGPGVGGNLATMARAAARGLLPQIGDGAARRSLISLDNVASAVQTAVDSSTPGNGMHTYLLTDARPYTVAQLNDALVRASGRRVLRPRLPLAAARIFAYFGDLGERLLRRPLPFSSEVLARLAASAEFSSEPFQRDFSWRPVGDFSSQAAAILAALERR